MRSNMNEYMVMFVCFIDWKLYRANNVRSHFPVIQCGHTMWNGHLYGRHTRWSNHYSDTKVMELSM